MDFKQSRKKITKAPISKEALAQVRQKTVLERKKHFRQTLLLTVVAMPIIVLVVFFAFRDFSFVFPGSRFDEPKPTPSELLAQKKDKYLFYLKDGDNWLQKRNSTMLFFNIEKRPSCSLRNMGRNTAWPWPIVTNASTYWKDVKKERK